MLKILPRVVVPYTPEEVKGPSQEDIIFLQEIKNNCYSDRNGWNNAYKIPKTYLEKILELVGEEKMITLRPMNTNWGFSVGYLVEHVTPCPCPFLDRAPATSSNLLQFLDRQLPEEYNFSKLSEIFMREDNLNLIASSNIEAPSKEKWKYEY